MFYISISSFRWRWRQKCVFFLSKMQTDNLILSNNDTDLDIYHQWKSITERSKQWLTHFTCSSQQKHTIFSKWSHQSHHFDLLQIIIMTTIVSNGWNKKLFISMPNLTFFPKPNANAIDLLPPFNPFYLSIHIIGFQLKQLIEIVAKRR